MKKKKKYLCPEIDIVYSYDFESELMYGNGAITGGNTSTIITGSNGNNISGTDTGGSGSSSGSTGGVDDGSERAKSNIWGSLWEDDF